MEGYLPLLGKDTVSEDTSVGADFACLQLL